MRTSRALDTHDDDHDRGLAFDVGTLMARRRALQVLGGAGLLALVGCGTSGSDATATAAGAGAASTTAAGAAGSGGSSGSSDGAGGIRWNGSPQCVLREIVLYTVTVTVTVTHCPLYRSEIQILPSSQTPKMAALWTQLVVLFAL